MRRLWTAPDAERDGKLGATVSTLDKPAPPPDPVAGARPPALRVTMDVGFPEDLGRSLASVHVQVSGGRPPVRLHFYVDGELAAVQSGTGLVYDVLAERIAPGGHTITVRASDVLGRWAGTSMRLDLPLAETTLATLETASVSGRGRPWRVRNLVSRIWH